LKEVFEQESLPANNIISAKGLRIDGRTSNQKSNELEFVKI
jgi:hypothetical protein